MRELLLPFRPISLLFNKSLASVTHQSSRRPWCVHCSPRRQTDEQLQACIESAVPVEAAAGENCSESAADLPGQKRREAEDAVDVRAYRQYHSTETVVTKVYNGMLMAADSGQVSALCLLYLSAAFDTVDHDLLMQRLERQYGLRSVMLQWFSSYSLAEFFKSSMGAVRHQPSTSHVTYHKAQCSVRVCSSCTWQTWKTTSRNMASVSTHLQTTCSYMYTVVTTK